jgi:HD-GYP domain-containing protein (c-di-GMP phosphodiesterase class II)
MSLIIVERGKDQGKRLPLLEFPITIGRDPANALVIDDDGVSRFHLRIKKRGKIFVCEDLDSRNGTFLNGDRILNSIVKNGDKILVGMTELQFLTSESDIQIATDPHRFDIHVSDSLGLKGPIAISAREAQGKFTPIRLNQLAVANHLVDDIPSIKEVFELHSNILVIDDIEEAGKALLKALGKLIPAATRAALFVWSQSNRQLIPCAVRHFRKKKETFQLSQSCFEDVLTRKQGVILLADSPEATQGGRHRLVLPMIQADEIICLIHLEADNPLHTFKTKEIELAQALITRCVPQFEAMLLRRDVDAWMMGMIETIIATIEAKDTYTHGHSERVSRYSMAIAEELKLSRDLKRLLLISSLCHDVGKIGIPDAILKKASMLSSEEYEEMKLHPTIGANIIEHMPNAKRFISGVKHHHEKWDGTGYPDGLIGEEIPFFGRIVAVADVFDAMVSGRAYSGFIDQSDAVAKLVEEIELFDPEIIKACVKAHESGALTLKTNTAGQDANPLSKENSSDEKNEHTNIPASVRPDAAPLSRKTYSNRKTLK